MSIQEDCWQERIPDETARIGGIILTADDPYRLMGDHVGEILHLADFAHLYSKDGRGAVCPIVLSLVTLFQFMENLPDREAAKAAVVRLDWKYALHVAVEWQGFHYSTLCNYRKRMLEHGEERLLFDKVLNWVVQEGFLKTKSQQRSDSTHVLGKVAALSRLELLWETLRLALRALKGSASTWYASAIPGVYDEVYRARQHDWHLSQKEVKQATKQAGRDGFWLLDQIEASAPEGIAELSEIETLRRVLEQSFTRSKPTGGEGGQNVRLRSSKRGEGKHRVVSPHEKEARWSQKRGQSWIGYKLQVTETTEAEAGSTFLTDVRVTPATTHDSEVVTAIQEQLAKSNLCPQQQIVDQGYVSGPNMARSLKRGIDLFGPMGGDNSGKTPGYQQQDFAIDWEEKKVTCPQGNASQLWKEYNKSAKKPGIYVRFNTACRACKAWGACTTSEQGRTLFLNAYRELIATRRAQQQTEEFRQAYKSRAPIEGTISTLVRKYGARHARYRGLKKVNMQAVMIGAAVNLKQLSRALHQHRKDRHYLPMD